MPGVTRSGRLIALIMLVTLLVVGCGKASPSTSASTSDGPSSSSCGLALCNFTTPTALSGANGGWVAATTNLAGLPSECGNMSLLSADPLQDEVVAGVAQQGLWESSDGAANWTRLGTGAGSAVITNRPSSITYDPADPNTFWESGTYNSGGAYETTDGGATFKQLGDLVHSDFVSVDLSDPARKTLLSGRHESSNLYRSTDGGSTWADISSPLPPGIGNTTSPLILSSSLFLLGTSAQPGSGVFRSTDGGATWSRVYPGGISGSPLIAKSDGAIYWLLAHGNGLIKSTDQGATWQTVIGPGTISITAANLIELPNGWLATLGANVIVSADHGVSWEAVGPTLPYQPSGIIYAPFRKAFYIWLFDCNFTGNTSVKADAIMRWNFSDPA